MTKPSRSVLVVEDDLLVRRTLERIADWMGFEVTAVKDGMAGLRLLGERRFQLVITDLRMPGASGLAVARRAAELEPPPAVLVVSGFIEAEDEIEIKRVGAHVLPKPFEPEVVKAMIERVLPT